MRSLFLHINYAAMLVLSLLWSPNVLAQNSAGSSGNFNNNAQTQKSGIENPLQVDSITALFTALLEILTIFAIPIVVFFIIYAGFLYVTARGNTDQVTQAHRALLYAVIGGVIILGGRVLIEVIQGTVESVKNSQ